MTHWIFLQMRSRKAFTFHQFSSQKCIIFWLWHDVQKRMTISTTLMAYFYDSQEIGNALKINDWCQLAQKQIEEVLMKIEGVRALSVPNLFRTFLGKKPAKIHMQFIVWPSFFVTLIALSLLVPINFKSVPRGLTFLF